MVAAILALTAFIFWTMRADMARNGQEASLSFGGGSEGAGGKAEYGVSVSFFTTAASMTNCRFLFFTFLFEF